MRQRKLHHLLSLLSEVDRQQFSLFLSSPYFNQSKTLILFWEQWRSKVLERPEAEEVTEEEFVEGTALKRSRIDALCWELFVKAREFLAQQVYEKDRRLKAVLFSEAILDRDRALAESHRFVPQVEKELEKEPESPEKHLALLYYRARKSRAKILARKTKPDWEGEFKHLHQTLTQFSLAKGLQLGCGVVNATRIFRQKEEQATEAFFQKYLEEGDPENENLLTRLYRLTLSLLAGREEPETFNQILKILELERELIAASVRNDLFSYLLNHCIRQINLGNDIFLSHTFSLYKLLFKTGDMLPNGQLSPQQFKNTVVLACRLNHLEWAEDFIESYHPRLSDPQGGWALKYNRAVLHFHQSRYPEAIQCFKEMVQESAEDVFYGLDARIYLWKSYFEHLEQLSTTDIDDMYKLYDSFRLYVDRNEKISPLHQLQYRNFVRLFKKFMKCLEKTDPKKRMSSLRAFQQKLEETKDVANKTWFKEKVAESLER